MKGTGQGLVADGVVLNVVGFVFYFKGIDELNTSNNSYNSYNESSSNDGSGAILGGLLLMIVGDVALATEITIWIVLAEFKATDISAYWTRKAGSLV